MPTSRALALAPAVLLLALGAAACSDGATVFSADPGQCIEDLDDATGGEISDLPEADCDEPHFAEVIHVFDHEGDDFPGLEELTAEATEVCQGEAFEDYTGTPYIESAIVVQPITPSERSWNEADDRESICIASTGEEVDVSFEGNGEDFLLTAG